jgi:excinuclease UvrABC nuclease subunit
VFIYGAESTRENPNPIFEYSFPVKCKEFMYNNLWNKHGVYVFVDNAETIVYVGKSTNVASRILDSYGERYKYADISKILYYIDDSMANINVLELIMISKYNPVLNSDCRTDDELTIVNCKVDLSDFSELEYFNTGEIINEEQE